MNVTKMRAAEQSLNAMAKKVLEAIPTDKPASLHQIAAAMWASGSKPSWDVIEGAAHRCVEVGLARETTGGVFQRITARLPAVVKADDEAPPPVEKEQTPEPTLLDKLGSLATTLRKAADEIESVALGVEDELQRAGAGAAKLRQLQALLKGLE